MMNVVCVFQLALLCSGLQQQWFLIVRDDASWKIWADLLVPWAHSLLHSSRGSKMSPLTWCTGLSMDRSASVHAVGGQAPRVLRWGCKAQPRNWLHPALFLPHSIVQRKSCGQRERKWTPYGERRIGQVPLWRGLGTRMREICGHILQPQSMYH